MKPLLSLAASLALLTNLFAQGTVNFANGGAAVNAPFTLLSSLSDPWVAMLYAGPVGTPEHLLSSTIVSGAPVSFTTTAGTGYIFGGGRTIAGIPSGSLASLQIRIWRTDFGATWEDAGGPLGQNPTGRTVPITLALGGGLTPTPNMVGLTGVLTWNTPLIPEPSTTIVGVLGLVAMAVIRRKRSNAPLN
jgi:hypothetical protein